MFAVPGVYLTLPSQRGEVRLTPLFLSRQRLDDTFAAVQELITHQVCESLDQQMLPLVTADSSHGAGADHCQARHNWCCVPGLLSCTEE